ncbi:MAG: methyltransferase domain-containing protein [Ekhidna sp.]|nr:methyltransferase domain-containing protein [Ekhidna sp.]
MNQEEAYWTDRYRNNSTGWDIGFPSTPLKEYIDQLTNKNLKILIPGAGSAYEAEYLHSKGFDNVHVLDISSDPLEQFHQRVPTFPEKHLLHQDFFKLAGEYDLILEQTFFCSFYPSKHNRQAYVSKISELLRPGGKLAGVWFKHPLEEHSTRPYGGYRAEYLSYLTPHLALITFEDCFNSIPPRSGNELFGIFQKS